MPLNPVITNRLTTSIMKTNVSDDFLISQALLAMSELATFHKCTGSQSMINLIRQSVKKDSILYEFKGEELERFIDEISRINLFSNKFESRLTDLGLEFRKKAIQIEESPKKGTIKAE